MGRCESSDVDTMWFLAMAFSESTYFRDLTASGLRVKQGAPCAVGQKQRILAATTSSLS